MKKYMEPELTSFVFADIISSSTDNPNKDDFGVIDDLGDINDLKGAQ